MKRFARIALFLCAVVALVPGARAAADLILVGAPVYTMDDSVTIAAGVAMANGRVVRVGTQAEVLAMRGAGTRVVELPAGWCVLPGLIDSHGHMYNLGKSLSTVSLLGTTSKEACVARVEERVGETEPGRWIEGRGWDQNDWPEQVYPSWRDLAGTETHPVYLRRVDGHAAWLNRTALAAAGIGRETPDPPGGVIVRDGDGEPTGILIDNATDLASERIPDPTAAEMDDRMRAAAQHCVRHGLVGVHDAGADASMLESYQRLWNAGELPLRVYAMLPATDSALLDEWFARGPATLAGGRVVVRAVKMYADGALGSRGAALLAPYLDDPGNTGLMVSERETLREVTARAFAAGFQPCTHAIGDRGNRVALDVYDEVLGDARGGEHRFRIEHCQVVAPSDFVRFRDLGVIAAMQPTHATSDMYWAEARVGSERIRGAYAWRRFLELGVPLALGSDFPVENVNPLWGIYAAVTRQDHEGWPEGGWYPQESLAMEEAIRGFTVGAAFAEFAEGERGALSEGMRADIVVVDRDVFAVEPDELLAAAVMYTIVDGVVVYDAGASD